MIVIIEGDQVAQLKMTSSRSSFTCYTFHGTSVAEERVGVVVDQVVAWLVEHASGMRLSYSQTHSIGETLTKWSCRYLNTWGVVGFRVARSDAVDLLKTS